MLFTVVYFKDKDVILRKNIIVLCLRLRHYFIEL